MLDAKQKIEILVVIEEMLFNMAASYVTKETKPAAIMLNGSRNLLQKAIDYLSEGENKDDLTVVSTTAAQQQD